MGVFMGGVRENSSSNHPPSVSNVFVPTKFGRYVVMLNAKN